MKLRAEEILQARKTGRSWTEIAQKFGIPVSEAKSILAPIKAQARRTLSRRPESESRPPLQEFCYCGCTRLLHGDYSEHEGGCRQCGPTRIEYEWYDHDWNRHNTAERPSPDEHASRISIEEKGCDYFEFFPGKTPYFRGIYWLYPPRPPRIKGWEKDVAARIRELCPTCGWYAYYRGTIRIRGRKTNKKYGLCQDKFHDIRRD